MRRIHDIYASTYSDMTSMLTTILGESSLLWQMFCKKIDKKSRPTHGESERGNVRLCDREMYFCAYIRGSLKLVERISL